MWPPCSVATRKRPAASRTDTVDHLTQFEPLIPGGRIDRAPEDGGKLLALEHDPPASPPAPHPTVTP